MDRGAWWVTVQGVKKSWTQLNNTFTDTLYGCDQTEQKAFKNGRPYVTGSFLLLTRARSGRGVLNQT